MVLGELMDAVGLQALQHRVAIERVEDPRDIVRPRRVAVPDRAETEEDRHDGQAEPVAGGDEVLDRGEHAVALAAFAGRRARIGQPAGCEAGLSGREPAAVAGQRLPGLGGDLLGREVVVAAAVGPADVVEQQQRQRGALGALADQPQLLADREVVVVAVDDRRVGQRDRREGGEARLADQLELGVVARERLQAGLRRRVDRADAGPRAGRPVDEHAREVAGERTHLDHPPGARGVQAGQQDLGRLGQRHPPVLGVVEVGVEVH